MMRTYRDVTAAGWSTRDAAELVGVARATATRKPTIPLPIPLPVPAPVPVPVNKLNRSERARILDLVNSPNFVDLPPVQI